MIAIQKFSHELLAPHRKWVAAAQVGITCAITAITLVGSYYNNPTISPQFAFAAGVISVIVSNLTDSAFKAYWDKNPDGSRPLIFSALKAGILGAMIGGSTLLIGELFNHFNIPIGQDNAETTLTSILALLSIKIHDEF
jgi:hypothetical protein